MKITVHAMKRTLLILGMCFAVLLSLACKKASESRGNNGDTGNIRIGIYADLSGQTAATGQYIKNAVEFARDEINQAGGINGRQMELVVVDDKGLPDQAAAVVAGLISQNHVHALVGEAAAASSLSAAAKAQEAGVPMVSLSASDLRITQQGDQIFRIASLDSLQGTEMAKYAANNLKAKTAAILFEAGSDYSSGLAQAFESEFTKAGGQVTAKQSYAAAANQSFKDQLTGIGSANPDVIYVPGRSAESGMICKEAKAAGIKSVMLGADGWNSPKFFEIAGSSSDGAYITTHFSADDPTQDIRSFASGYKKRFGSAPDQEAALAFDAIRILADALKRAGSSDSSKLRAALAQTVKFSGLTGVISIDPDRNATRPATIFKLQDGKIYPVYRAEA
jgi:branched-chain amino acid transport system substrate-binding protein